MGKIKHGHSFSGRPPSPEYRAYYAMKNRCLNPRQKRFKDYAGRGIVICSRWLDGADGISGFECFLADMGPKPSVNHSVDRRENNDGYSPDNCRWATRREQSRNTRTTVHINACGMTMTLPDAAEYFGRASAATIRRRLALGWDQEDAVLTATRGRIYPKLEVCF